MNGTSRRSTRITKTYPSVRTIQKDLYPSMVTITKYIISVENRSNPKEQIKRRYDERTDIKHKPTRKT